MPTTEEILNEQPKKTLTTSEILNEKPKKILTTNQILQFTQPKKTLTTNEILQSDKPKKTLTTNEILQSEKPVINQNIVKDTSNNIKSEVFGQQIEVTPNEYKQGLDNIIDNPFSRVLIEPVKDVAKLFEGGQFPFKYQKNKNERYYAPTTKNGFIDLNKMSLDNDGNRSSAEFTKNIAKHTSQIIFGDLWWVGETAFDLSFATIVAGIGLFGQATEEVISETLGEEGFADLQKKIFNSNTIPANEIKEHIEEISHILLAKMISRGHRVSPKSAFNIAKDTVAKEYNTKKNANEILTESDNLQIIEEVIKQKEENVIKITDKDVVKIKNDLIINDIKTKTEPYLEETKNKINDYIIDDILDPIKNLNIQEKINIKKQINSRVNEKILKSEQPNYIQNIQEIRDLSNSKNKNIQPSFGEFSNTFNYKGKYRPKPNGSYLKIKEEYGIEYETTSHDFGNKNSIFNEIKIDDPNVKPISRQEILGEFLKDLGVPISTGRIKSKNTLGFYVPPSEQVRTKFPYDLNTGSHEIGHWINGRFPEITKKYFSDPVMKEELKSMGYDYLNPQEGFADFIKLYLNKKELAQKYAPNFYQWFESNLINDKFITNLSGKNMSIKKAMLNAQGKFSSYWKQGNVARIKSKIGTTRAIDNMASKESRFIQENLDNLHGIERMEGILNTDFQVYKSASSLRQGQQAIQYVLQTGTIYVKIDPKSGRRNIGINNKGKSFKDIVDPISDRLEDWKIYIISKSAKELKMRNKENLFTSKEIEAGLNIAGKDRPKFDKAFLEYQEWKNHILDFASVYGELFTKEDIKKFSTREFYLPFDRVTSNLKQNRQFKNKVNEFTGIKSITGGTENLKDIIDNMTYNAKMFIENAIENRAKLDVLDIVKENLIKGSERFVVLKPLPPTIVGKIALTKDIKSKIIDSFGDIANNYNTVERAKIVNALTESIENLGDFAKLLTVDKRPSAEFKKVMPVMQQGKIFYYEVVDKLLYSSLTNLKNNAPIRGPIMKLFGITKKLGQNGITLAFDFLAKNFIRGELFSTIMSDSYIPFLDGVKGFGKQVVKNKDIQEYRVNGLDMGSYYNNEGLFNKNLGAFYKKKGISLSKIVTSPLKLIELWQDFANASEMSARFSVAINKRKKGGSLVDSVYEGKSNLVDFGMKGAYETNYGQTFAGMAEVTMFLKPAVLGLYTVYKGLAKKPNRKSVAVKTMTLGAISASLYAMNSMNPLFHDIEDWDKNANWFMFVPTKKGMEYLLENGKFPIYKKSNMSGENITPEDTLEAMGYDSEIGSLDPYFSTWRIPKIWEIGTIGTVSEIFMETILKGFKNINEVPSKVYEALSVNWNYNLFPQALHPFFEIATNKKSFTGQQIVSNKDKDLRSDLQGSGKSNKLILEFTKTKIAKKFNLSAPQIEALFTSYLGTLGMQGLALSEQVFFDQIEDLPISKYPLIGSFYKGVVPKNTKNVTKSYELSQEINKILKSTASLANQFRMTEAKDYLSDNIDIISTGANEFTKALNEMNKIKNFIRSANTIEMTQKLARDVSKMGNRNSEKYIKNLIDLGIYNDTGKLKSYLNNDLNVTRNYLAQKYVKFIESKED